MRAEKTRARRFTSKGGEMVGLGDIVRDTVTGFEGIAVAEYRFLHGCRRFSVQPSVDKDGKVPDAQVFDEPQLTVLESGVVEVVPFDQPGAGGAHKARSSGGPPPYTPAERL